MSGWVRGSVPGRGAWNCMVHMISLRHLGHFGVRWPVPCTHSIQHDAIDTPKTAWRLGLGREVRPAWLEYQRFAGDLTYLRPSGQADSNQGKPRKRPLNQAELYKACEAAQHGPSLLVNDVVNIINVIISITTTNDIQYEDVVMGRLLSRIGFETLRPGSPSCRPARSSGSCPRGTQRAAAHRRSAVFGSVPPCGFCSCLMSWFSINA